MSNNLEKLARFLDALKLSQGSGKFTNDAVGSTGTGSVVAEYSNDASSNNSSNNVGIAATVGSGIGQAVRSFPSSTEQFLEQTAAVASLASSITQQGQTLLSKRDPSATKRERQQHCQLVVESVVGATIRRGGTSGDSRPSGTDTSRLLSIAVETLLLLADDTEPDVRMTADEALNRIVRGTSPAQVAKVLVEQMKDKIEGSARVLRAALSRFAVLAKHIRVQKGRAYVQTLVPLLCQLSQRPEESLQEALSSALNSGVCPSLGHFASDTELKLLLAAFQARLSQASAAGRRAAARALLAIAQHARRPKIFLATLAGLLLRALLPLGAPRDQVLGCLVCLSYLAPELPALCPQSLEEEEASRCSSVTTATHDTSQYTVSIEQLLQVYHLSIHYSGSNDFNIVTAALELLRALLEHSPTALVTALVTPGGVSRCYLERNQDARSGLSSRTPSCGSLSILLPDDELSLEPDTPTGAVVVLAGHAVLEEDRGGGVEAEVPQGEIVELEDEEEEEEETSSSVMPCEVTEESLETDLYAGIEVGQLVGEEEPDIFCSTRPTDESPLEFPTEADLHPAEGCDEDSRDFAPHQAPPKGSLGPPWGAGVSGQYAVRFLCSRFLLAGHSGSLLGERQSRVSAKVLALACLARLLVWQPAMMGETLWLGEQGEDELLVQRIWDVCRYCRHADPSVRAVAASLAGHYLRAAAEEEGGAPPTRGPADRESLLATLGELVRDNSAVCVRGALCGLRACLPPLLRSTDLPAALPLLPRLLQLTQHKYWLVKVEVCELLSELPLCFVDFLQRAQRKFNHPTPPPSPSADSLSLAPNDDDADCLSQSRMTGEGGQFSHRVLYDALLPLLPDTDHRVRAAAVSAIARLVPQLLIHGDLYSACVSSLYRPGYLFTNNIAPNLASSSSSDYWSSTGVFSNGCGGSTFPPFLSYDPLPTPPPPPFDALLQRYRRDLLRRRTRAAARAGCSSAGGHQKLPQKTGAGSEDGDGSLSFASVTWSEEMTGLECLEQHSLNDSVGRVVHAISLELLRAPDHQMRAGCVHALCEVSQCCPPALYPDAWGCCVTVSGGVACLVVLRQSLALTTDPALVADLTTQAAVIILACNLLAGVAVGSLEQQQHQPPPPPGQRPSAAFSNLGPPAARAACSSVLLHVSRVLAVYRHVLDSLPVQPHARLLSAGAGTLQSPQLHVDPMSPLKKRTRPVVGENVRSDAATTAASDTRTADGDFKKKSGTKAGLNYGGFTHLPEYLKLYEVIKSAYNNYKMSICDASEQRVSVMLRASLSGLCCLLEVLHSDDVLPALEPLLLCCTAATALQSRLSVQAAQQLVKCLFGSNLAAQWSTVCPGPASPVTPADTATDTSCVYGCAVDLPLLQLQSELLQVQQDLLHTADRRTDVGTPTRRPHPRPSQSIRPSLGSYIRLFEPLVIRALNQYTVSSCVQLQRAVLQLLVCLVHIRVNYCLLDSNQIFLRYVIKQLDNIEEGHVRDANVLLPPLFAFLVSVSCERQQSRSLVTVPKILQLSDGLLASGQPWHCVLALGPLVQEVFVRGDAEQSDSGDVGLQHGTSEAAELATTREVLSRTLLRLAHYYQVMSLVGAQVRGARQQGPKRWQQVSMQMADVLLPLLARQKMNLYSQEAVCAVVSVMCSLCPSVFSPPDALLRTLLSSPEALESTRSVEVWGAGVVIALRVMVSRCTASTVLSRLSQLGLSMQYVADSEPPPSPPPCKPISAAATYSNLSNYSPNRRKLATKLTTSCESWEAAVEDTPDAATSARIEIVAGDASFIDPLGVAVVSPRHGEAAAQPALADSTCGAQPSVQPEAVLARFLLEALRVCCCELRCLWYQRQAGEVPADAGVALSHGQQDEQMLGHLAHQLFLHLLWMAEHNDWHVVVSSLRSEEQRPHSTRALCEVCECVVSVRAAYPSLAVLCCRLHVLLDLPGTGLWPHVLRSQGRGRPGPGGRSPTLCSTGPSGCLPLQFLRRSALQVFAEYVAQHLCEEEWLAWLLVQHSGDVVALQRRPAMLALLRHVHASAAASALLLHALCTRGCVQLYQASQGDALLATVSGVHGSQSGTLVLFLLKELLVKPHFLHLSGATCSVLHHRLQLLLSPAARQQLQQITPQQLQPFIVGGRHYHVVKSRSPKVAALLVRLQQCLPGSATQEEDDEQTCTPATSSDLAWYLRLTAARCRSKSGASAEECCELLLSLELPDLLTVMQHSTFSIRLLQHTFHYGLQAILQGSPTTGKDTAEPPNSNNSSPNSNRSNSTNTSSVSSGSTNSSTSGGEHPLYAASRLVLMTHLQRLVALLPRPHHDYRPGGGNKYSDHLNQVLESTQMPEQMEQLALACTCYLDVLEQLPWREQLHATHAISVMRFAGLLAEWLQLCAHRGRVSLWRVSVSVSCLAAAVACGAVWQRLAMPDNTATFCGMVAGLHGALAALTPPHSLPRLPAGVWESVSACGAAGTSSAAARLIQLVLWLERHGHASLPPALAKQARSLIMGLGRCPVVNGVLRCPPEVWVSGWDSPFSSLALLPPIPLHLLQEPDILQQFVYRSQLFGWLNRQQFEETWMALLSVLNTGDDTAPQERPFRNQSMCVCLRGLSGLLAQTLLQPTPGNPHIAAHSLQKDTQHLTRRVSPSLKRVFVALSGRQQRVRHLTDASTLPPLCVPLVLPATTVAAALDASSTEDGVLMLDGEEAAVHRQRLSASGLDVASCTRFLHDLFGGWLVPGQGLCSTVVCEIAKCLCALVELLSSGEQQAAVVRWCASLYATHPAEDTSTRCYLVLAAAKALAVCRIAGVSVPGNSSEAVLRMLDAGLQSGSSALRCCALRASLCLLQPPPLCLPTVPASAPDSGPRVPGSALQLPTLSTITSHMKGPASEETFQPGTAQDVLLAAVVHMTAHCVAAACDTRCNDGEALSQAAWSACVCLVEQHSALLLTPSSAHHNLPATALHLALATAADANTTPTMLHTSLDVVSQLAGGPAAAVSGNSEAVLKLVLDLVLYGPPAVSLPALPLLLQLLYSSGGSSDEPEQLLQLLERLGVVFERIRICYEHEAWLLSGLLGPCILGLVPAAQVLNKVITEYISGQQPRPHLLVRTLFQVFEACSQESGEGLVQEWVLLSLGNFTQREPVALAVWCITCFLVAASRCPHLRAALPSVAAWPAALAQSPPHASSSPPQLRPDQLELSCLAAAQFSAALPTPKHRHKFREVFADVAAPGSPFQVIIDFLDSSVHQTPFTG